MSYVIARPINGITINGLEFVRDEEDRVRKFKNPKTARDFLRDNGITKPEREGIEIIPENEAFPDDPAPEA